jgi:hypothetical protein
MEDLLLLKNNIELLLHHSKEIINFQPYYYSNIYFNGGTLGTKKPAAIPLGPWMEFWEQYPLKNYGKLLLTVECLGDNCLWSQEILDAYNHPSYPLIAALKMRVGYNKYEALPGIKFSQLQDDFIRYIKQFRKPDVALGVPLSQLVKELRDEKPIHERDSYACMGLIENFYKAVTDKAGTSSYTAFPFEPKEDLNYQESSFSLIQTPVTFSIQQAMDMSIKLIVNIALPVRLTSSREIALPDKLNNNCISRELKSLIQLLDDALVSSRFLKVVPGDPEAVVHTQLNYEYAIDSPAILRHPESAERMIKLLEYLEATVKNCRL